MKIICVEKKYKKNNFFFEIYFKLKKVFEFKNHAQIQRKLEK